MTWFYSSFCFNTGNAKSVLISEIIAHCLLNPLSQNHGLLIKTKISSSSDVCAFFSTNWPVCSWGQKDLVERVICSQSKGQMTPSGIWLCFMEHSENEFAVLECRSEYTSLTLLTFSSVWLHSSNDLGADGISTFGLQNFTDGKLYKSQ